MKTRHKIALAAFAILVVGIVAYITIPFPKFEQIDVRAYTTPDDKKETVRFYSRCDSKCKDVAFPHSQSSQFYRFFSCRIFA